MAVIEDATRLAYARALAVEVEASYPDVAANAANTVASIGAALEAGEAYGLLYRSDLRIFVYLCARLGWEIQRHAWIDAALTDPAIAAPSQRLAYVAAELLRREAIVARNDTLRRQFASQLSDPDAGR